MFKIDNSFLHSKFSRRIFLLFVLSAVIPIVAIALLSFNEISKQLEKQGYDQSRVVCKAIGMELYRRLTLAHDELMSVGNNINAASKGSEYSAAGLAGTLAPDFDELTLISFDGKKTYLHGKYDQIPALNAGQHQKLEQGKTVIQTRYDRENRLDLYLIQAAGRHKSAHGLLVGRLHSDFIWAVNDLLPSASDVLIISQDGRVLHRSRPSLQAMIPNLQSALAESITGHLEWTLDGESSQASYWSLFTQDLFAAPNLIIAVSKPESIALASVRDFRSIYFPLLLLGVLCVSFVAAKQIRKKLAPLVWLRDATQRIAGGDFTGRVNITADDEFAELGNSFNVMAGRLETQFTSLTTLSEIDRLILSSFDARFIITTVLNRVGELTSCTLAAVLLFHEDEQDRGVLSLCRNVEGARLEESDIQVTHDEIRNLHDNALHILYDSDMDYPSYIKGLVGGDTQSFLVFPTFIKERLSTVLLFGYRDAKQIIEDDIDMLRKFSDHVAVALANAKWEEKLYHQAHYDNLTNLPNRALLKDRLEQAIARAQRNRSYVGVLFLDLDRFKLVNDSMGHAAGDAILKQMADKLMCGIRGVDTVVRFGGDEFVIVIPDIEGNSNAAFKLGRIADKLLPRQKNLWAVSGTGNAPSA